MTRLIAPAIGLVACGCATEPLRPFPTDALEASGGVAYLWSAGKVKQPALSMQDFAVVTKIDDFEIPSAYLPNAGLEPFSAWRVSLPVGTHVVEVLNKETSVCMPSYFGLACTVVEKSTRKVEFAAESGRSYTPLVDEKCGRKWFWIADSGPYDPSGEEKAALQFTDNLPVVGGEAPPYSCAAPAAIGTSDGR